MSRILFEIVADQTNIGVALEELRARVKQLNKEISQGNNGAQRTRELREELVKAKSEAARLADEQRRLNREFKSTQVPKDSLTGLRLEYARLTEQLSRLSKAERESKIGQGLISNAAGIKQQVDQIEQSIGRFTGNVGNYKSAISGVASTISKVAAIAGGAFALLTGGSEIVNATREFEKLFAVLKNAVGNDNAALRIFDSLQKFAAETPFQINELVSAFTKLQQRNFHPTIEQLRTMGDIASSSGKSIDQFVEAILDAQTGEFERLKEFGIVARKSGEELKVSFRGQSQTISNSSAAVTDYLLKIGKLPGVQGAATAVAKTLDGSISNLVDNFTRLSARIGSSGGLLKSFVELISDGIGALNDWVSVPLSETLRNQQGEFNALISILQDANAEESTRQKAIEQLNTQYKDYIGNVNLDTASQADLVKVLDAGNKLFLQRIFLQQNEEQLTDFAERRLKAERGLFETRKKLEELAQKGIKPDANPVAALTYGRGNAEANTLAVTLQAFEGTIKGLNAEQAKFSANQKELSESIFGSGDAAAKAAEDYKKLGDQTTNANNQTSKTAEAAAGSVAALQKEVQRLQEKLDKTAPSNSGIALLVAQLDAAQAALKSAQAEIDRVRTAGRVKIAARFAPGADTTQAPDLGIPSDFASDEKAAADRRRQEAEKAREAELADQREYQDRLFQINKEAAEKEQALRKEAQEKEAKDNEERKQRNLDIALETGAAVANAIFEVERNRLDRQTSQALTALDEEYKRRIELATGNAALQEKLQKEQEKKRLQIEKAAAKERQNIAIKQALIQGALNALKAYFTEGIAGAIEAAALTLLQVATIKLQSFARGGVVKMGIFKGKPHSQGGTKGVFSDGTHVEVEKDEAFVIVNKRNTPMLRHLSNVNAAGGHGKRFFAGGGAIDFTPQIALPRASGTAVQVQAEAGFSDEQTMALGKTIGVLVAREVANQIQPALANGLNDANRRTEREKALKTNQTV